MKLYRIVKNTILSLLAKRTVGVRALVVQDNQVLLVKHTYQPQWYTVGGAVEKGETPLQAIIRELKEEVGAILNSPPQLLSVHYSRLEKRDDYIIFYLVKPQQLTEVNSPEILEKKWFAFDELPIDISPATERRINEYLGKAIISDTW